MSDPARVTRPLTVDAFIAFMEDRPNGERLYLDDGRPAMNSMPTLRHDRIQTNIVLALRSHRAMQRPN